MTDYAANLAFFLLKETGSIFGCWSGKLSADQQRQLTGRVIGRGRIVIDGSEETVSNRVSVCFGQDWDDRKVIRWAAL